MSDKNHLFFLAKSLDRHTTFVVFVLLALSVSSMAGNAAENAKPNVVLIYIDDLGYGDLGAYGCVDIPTPNIDQLAREGVRCTASYITNPPCCPSRCGLMMGQYGQHFGKYGMSRGLPIPEDRPTLAKFLRDRGYVTGQIGKWEERDAELADTKIRDPCRKALVSLNEHWNGLTRFVDDPRIPLDNNYGERLIRNPAVGRKNYYGSGAEWSGRLAVMMFSIFATLTLSKINPRKWLSWYFDACAASGGKAPDNLVSFLPWNLSESRLAELQSSTSTSSPDTS